ncbi:MAG: hypothetical protein SGILL_003301 [Bacillariaceae sp.]
MTKPMYPDQHHQISHPHAGAAVVNDVAPGIDDRLSPTLVVTNNQAIMEGDKHTSPNPSTAPNSSANSTPMSTGDGAIGAYSVPNPVQSQHQIPEPPSAMDTGARSSTPSLLHYQHSQFDLSSPQSAPPLSGWATSAAPPRSNHTPVPSEIHTDGANAAGRGPVPFFPSMKNSASSNSISSKASAKSVQVTGKKKHSIKASNSKNNLDDFMVVDDSVQKGGKVTVRKQKRLERNRESARLSRRRRKQYLEVLEERVSQLSLEMDKGRRDHASQAIALILAKRSQALGHAMAQLRANTNATDHLDRSLWSLEDGPLSRHSLSMLILSTFYTQQLKSISLPSHSKYVMWLTLQNDAYYRGGRAASERLSAARIGERMLSNGNDKVTPANSMWPLVCNEVGLSYDQEERRVKFLAWASENADRIKSKMKHNRRQEEDQELHTPMVTDAQTSTSVDMPKDAQNVEKYQLDKTQHLAANLYILNHRLQTVLQEFPFHPPVIVTATSLKKLSRRPSFESLGQQRDSELHGLSRDTSFASMSSLKQSPSSLSLAGSVGEDLDKLAQTNQLTPEDAEQAASSMVQEVLGFVKPIIPPIVTPRLASVPHAHTIVPQSMSTYAASATSSAYPSAASATPTATSAQHHHLEIHAQGTTAQPQMGQQILHYHHAPQASMPAPQVQHHAYQQQPQLVHYQHAPPTVQPTQPETLHGYTPVPSPLDNLPPAAAPAAVHEPSGHSRKSSFLPPHLNVVPEDMFPANDTAAEDFFVGLMDDEDWAIGEGIDMDTTS